MMAAPTLPDGIDGLVGPYLERQDWYHDAFDGVWARRSFTVETGEVLPGSGDGKDRPGLGRLVVEADDERFQVVVGWRDPEVAADALAGGEYAILGSVPSPAGELLIYDALADEQLMLSLLRAATGGGASAERARVVESLTSHASIVFDDQLFMKLYRVLVPSPRREVEVMLRLDGAGFNHIVAPVAVWTSGGFDLAIVREFVSGALEGRALAVTSLRDLLGTVAESASDAAAFRAGDEIRADADEVARYAGGDLAGESRRLGAMTARMHVALAAAFGETDADADAVGAAISVVDADDGARVRAMHDVGKAIRVHGDYQLRRVMRTDVGWIVVGFGDDPSPSARLDPSRPVATDGVALEDVADMCHAFREVADSVLAEYSFPVDDETASTFAPQALVDAWVGRNAAAFVDGYLATEAVRPLLPKHPAAFHVLLDGLERVRAHRALGA